MNNFDKLKNMTIEKFAAEFMIFRPSDKCFDDDNKNYIGLDGKYYKQSQDCYKANLKWLNDNVEQQKIDNIEKSCETCVSRFICPNNHRVCDEYNDEGFFWGLIKLNFPLNEERIDRQRKFIKSLQLENN